MRGSVSRWGLVVGAATPGASSGHDRIAAGPRAPRSARCVVILSFAKDLALPAFPLSYVASLPLVVTCHCLWARKLGSTLDLGLRTLYLVTGHPSLVTALVIE